jgi:ketosteroid isomerase-like protein
MRRRSWASAPRTSCWDLSRSPFPDGRIYRGLAGVRERLGGLEDAFQDIDREIEEITDLGENQVLAIVRMKGSGQFSKIGVDYRFATVSTFREEKVVRMARYGDRAEALEAVGR